MPTAKILRAWQDSQFAYLAVAVTGDLSTSDAQYIGQVPLAALQGLTAAQVKAALVAAVKAQRDTAVASQSPDLPISGTIAI